MLAMCWITACAGSGGGGNGTPKPSCTPQVDPASISFANNIQPLFNTSCALGGCHDAATAIQGLNLSVGASYKAIVNRRSTEQANLKLIQPGNPDTSYLIQKIEATPGIAGVPMPQGCPGSGVGLNGAPCLSADQMQMFRTWVLACAPKN